MYTFGILPQLYLYTYLIWLSLFNALFLVMEGVKISKTMLFTKAWACSFHENVKPGVQKNVTL